VVSSKGNKYIMILYDYDSNEILAEPIKDRTAPELLKAFQVMEQELVARGLKPKLVKLDNEAQARYHISSSATIQSHTKFS
jgi:hypothetical protein